MPDVSIAISAQDRYSSAIKSMAQVTKSFSKDAEEMERTLGKLSQKRYALKMDLKDAQKQLEKAEKQFQKTGRASDELQRDTARAKFDGIQRNLALVAKGAREAEQQMQKAGEAFRKSDNQAGGLGFKGIVGVLATSGAGAMLGNLAQDAANTIASSMGGDAGGTLFSSALSTAISGAAMGSVIPGIGTAAGAAIGAGIGLVTGGIQVFQKEDDAFKTMVQGQYNALAPRRQEEISSGSGIASGRETDRISFSRLLGGDREALGYLEEVKALANTTPFLYGDLTTLSKTMLTYGTQREDMIPMLTAVGDAGAALGMSQENIGMVATAIGRMQSTDKASLEYINLLTERGVKALDWLAEKDGITTAQVYEKISKGQYSGKEVSAFLVDTLATEYGGMMAEQSKTFSGLASTLEGWQQEVNSGGGEAYNGIRSEGMAAEIDYLDGIGGAAMKSMNGIIGGGRAYQENLKEQYFREAADAVLNGRKTSLYDEDQTAKLQEMRDQYITAAAQYRRADAAGDTQGAAIASAEVESLKGQIETFAQGVFDTSTGMLEINDVQKELVSAIQDNTKAVEQWKPGYELSQVQSQGMAAAGARNALKPIGPGVSGGYQEWRYNRAMGQRVVPYDNFPALLHQGERVLTASEARQADQGGGVTVSFTGPVTVREEADLDKLARKLAAEVVRARVLAAP